MQEQVPKYFTEFAKDFKGFKDEFGEFKVEVKERLDKIESRFNSVEEKLDSHFEVIGEIKVQVTEIGLSLKDKASYEYVKEIDSRTKKLEKVAFA